MKTTLSIGAAIIVGVVALGAWSERKMERAIGADNHAAVMALKATVPSVALLGWRCWNESGYAHLSGEVRNDGQESIDSLEAVATFRTRGGTFVKAADALIEYRPLMPGQTSPFLVLTTWNPMISGCEVAFKTFDGSNMMRVKVRGDAAAPYPSKSQ